MQSQYSQAYKKFYPMAKFSHTGTSPEGNEGSWHCNLFNAVGIATTKEMAYKSALNDHLGI